MKRPESKPLAVGALLLTTLSGCGGHTSLGADMLDVAGGGGSQSAGGSAALGSGGGDAIALPGTAGTGASGGTAACPCTRRPGGAPSTKCVAGGGESVTGTIGPEGGNVWIVGRQNRATGGATVVEIAPGQLTETIELTLTETATPPPAELIDYSPIFTVRGEGLPSLVAVTLPAETDVGPIPRSLTVYAAESEEGPFSPVPGFFSGSGWAVVANVRSPKALLAAVARTPEQAGCP